MTFTVVQHEIKSGYALVTINRPDKLNALNADVLSELGAITQILRHNAEVRAIVITGAGPKSFVAGADIAQLHANTAETGQDFSEFGQQVFSALENIGKPVIAAVNGFALGGGCELAMACHIRFASKNAKFGQPEINLGILPGYGGTQRLPKLIGTSKALELILTGNLISADEAKVLGLVSSVYEPEELLPAAEALAELLATKAPKALSACLDAVLASRDTHVDIGERVEAKLFGVLCGTQDFSEGTKAFLEKRQATFTGK